MQNALEMLWTCAQVGNSGTGMYPRGATAHRCSFAPVATNGCKKPFKSLASLISGALNICQRRTHPDGSRSCARDRWASNNCLFKRHDEFAPDFSQPAPAPSHHSLYALSPSPSSSAPAIHTPKPKGHSPWQKKRPSSTFGLNLLY